MKKILKRIISDFHQAALPVVKQRSLVVPLDLNKIITILGPRRAGKTYFLYQLMGELEKQGVERHQILYLNFEDERLDLAGNNDLIFDAYRELYPDQDLSGVFIFFDEIQEVPGWEKFVRRIDDTISRHIFLTGSNANMLSLEIATSLRGRSISFEILPLSFKEYLVFRDISARNVHSAKDKAIVHNAFTEYCLWGGFPELVWIEERFKLQVLQEYFNVMLYRDLVERYGIRDIAVLKYLLKRLIGSFTREFSVNKLYNDLKSRGFAISKDSIYRMMEEIMSIYMLASVVKYDPAVVKREMSNKKIYLYDNGLSSAMNYAFSEDRGKLLENIVFTVLRTSSSELFFLRNGWECDFLAFPMAAPPLAVQVTERLTEENASRELKGLLAARKRVSNVAGLLLVGEMPENINVPKWIEMMTLQDWLLAL